MFQRNRRLALASASVALFTPAFAAEDVVDTEKAQIRVETVADGLEHPWAIAFLPDGNFLVTQNAGTMRIVRPDGVVLGPVDGVHQRVVQSGVGPLQ